MRIAHASISENNTRYGMAGDSTGKEVCIREWYSKPWDFVLRCRDRNIANKIADSAEKGALNNHIGYDQSQRNTLHEQAVVAGYNIDRITRDCECDCSSFVTVCCECASIKIPYNGNNAPTTRTMKTAFMSTGMFELLTGTNYTTTSKNLLAGDILVKEGVHTVICLSESKSNEIGYVKGIDVSALQNNIDWKKVKESGISFAILRITTKNGKIDTQFERNLKGCITNKIDYSCYKYSYAETELQARAEAQNVISVLNGRKMRIWLDLEDATQLAHIGKGGIEKVAKSFISECERCGYDVGIYCNLNWYKNYLSDDLKKYPLWIARYGLNDGTINEKYCPNVNEYVWQYTSVGRVNGIDNAVDLDVIRGI